MNNFKNDSIIEVRSRFLLLTIDIFYKVVVSTELVNTEPLLLRKIRFLWVSDQITAFWSALFYVIFLFKGTLFNIYCQFINIELRASSTIAHA